MKNIIAFFLVMWATFSSAVPLSSWPTWNTNQPFIAKQVPPNAMVMRGIGTDAYYVLEVDPATGEIPVALSGASISIDYSGATGDPVPADAAFIGGEDPNGDLQGVAVDVNGRLQVDAVTDNDFAGATGDPVPAEAGYMAGIDGTGDLQGLLVDASGQLQVDVTSSGLPAGAATEAKQDDEIAELVDVNTELDVISGDTTSIDTKIPAQGQATMAASMPVVIASNQTSIPVTNSNLPTSTSTNVGAADSSTLRVSEGSRTYAVSDYIPYAGINVTTSAWSQVIASTSANINLLCITDQSGQVMELGTGAAASETRVFLIAPGFSGCIPLRIASGTRISIKAVTATANSGYLILSGMN